MYAYLGFALITEDAGKNAFKEKLPGHGSNLGDTRG